MPEIEASLTAAGGGGFPAPPRRSNYASARGDLRKSTQAPSVLIVDDEADLLEEMATTLSEEGFSVLRAPSGMAALKLFAGNPEIGVVVTDVRMPELDGLQLIERLLAHLPADASKPQIIVLTGHGTMDTAIRALRLHASDFLSKPVTRADLVTTVRRAMDRCLGAREQSTEQADIRKRYSEMQNTLARINATLNRLLVGEAAGVEAAVSEGVSPPEIGDARPPERPDRIRAMLREHRVRARIFRSSVLLDPSWDMLLELMLAHIENKQTYLTSLCVVSGLPTTTALRRVEQLIASGLVRREDDPVDRRRVIVSLTESGVERLSAYLEQVERDGTKLNRA
ncbi:MAG TPA: response regulator [Vineibacter sp.]|nr:response regulator [Vineibacter sp.]